MNLGKVGDRIGWLSCSGIGTTAGTIVGTIATVRIPDKLQTAIMVIVVKNNEQRLQHPPETISDDLIDPHQVLIVEQDGKRGHGLNESVGALALSGRAWWHGHKEGTGVISVDFV